ncbi:hypothetical protein ACPUVO_00610 [Pseudocolwellia sp. HL-MZ19]|uniref:hypothetical protein n=1 Tax=Pseudocolwellia sp. HL-MZ19 TaxID=3400846 RepID=UPI003CF6CD3E
MIRDCPISSILSNEFKSSNLITHCKMRRAATIYHDIAYLRSVMKIALPVFDVTANWKIFEDAVPVLIEMKLVGKSQKRTSRPTENELEKLTKALTERQNKIGSHIPYVDILNFSILTCMRIGKIFSIK